MSKAFLRAGTGSSGTKTNGALDEAITAASKPTYCMEPREFGWTNMYNQPAQGERTLTELEEVTTRRVLMLNAVHQIKGVAGYGRVMDEVVGGSTASITFKDKPSPFQFYDRDDATDRLLAVESQLDEETLASGTDDASRRAASEVMRVIQIPSEQQRGEAARLLDPDTKQLYKDYCTKLAHREVEAKQDMWKRCLEDDTVAHFSCVLAFCCGEERLRKWFAENEELLFRGRVSALNRDWQRKMLQLADTGAEAVEEFAAALLGGLQRMEELHHARNERGLSEEYYKVPFTSVPRLVRDRKVLVKKGFAYLSHTQALDLVFGKFRALLHDRLAAAQRAMPQISAVEHDRVCALLEQIVRHHSMGSDDNQDRATGCVVQVEDIATHAERHMPLCMRQMDRAARRDKHLKFDGRFQYGTFLKRLGLSVDDLMRFFGETLTLKGGGNAAKFAKSPYGYAVRFWYGKEGKKTSYNASSCSSLITGAAPKAGMCHGCPFRHSSEDALKGLLRERRTDPRGEGAHQGVFGRQVQLSERDVDAIARKAQEGHYTVACHMYFEKVHNPYPANTSLFNSPFNYWQASVEWARQQSEKEAEDAGEVGKVTPQRERSRFSVTSSSVTGSGVTSRPWSGGLPSSPRESPPMSQLGSARVPGAPPRAPPVL
eukprot:TRINITY_DN6348_c0_g1_i1.p2 TRINITY_DN6348_c0_g1~~TRINITY_DN6348_c0_g1_i1.p2  ORF type:complete len:693 (+),score=244.10 TRINITY_DN6348_c0_g1_i1:107-2080(+)